MEECIFCESLERIILRKNDYFVWMANLNQSKKGLALMLVPIRHVEKFSDLTKEEKESLYDEVEVFFRNNHEKQPILRLNQGINAGQSIPHLHFLFFLNGADEGGISKVFDTIPLDYEYSLCGGSVQGGYSSSVDIWKVSIQEVSVIFNVFSLCLSPFRAGNLVIKFRSDQLVAYVLKRKDDNDPYRRKDVIEVVEEQIGEMKNLFI